MKGVVNGQDRNIGEREKGIENKSKELEKEVARLQTLVAEMVVELKELKELKELNKIKTENCKTMAEQAESWWSKKLRRVKTRSTI